MSLIEVAQKLLALNPDAVELFKKANGTSKPGLAAILRLDPPWAPRRPFTGHGPRGHTGGRRMLYVCASG